MLRSIELFKKEKEMLLKNCYKNSMQLAIKNNVRSIAFPNISSGIYKFSKELAAQIAIETIREFDFQNIIEEVVFVCFDKENYEL